MGLENFNELIGGNLKIKPKQLAVFCKIKVPPQSERAGIKFQTSIQAR